MPDVTDPSPAEPTETTERGTPARWGADDWIALFAVGAIATIARALRLGDPKKFVFDEVYYANEACLYMRGAERLCDFPKDGPPAEVHPPLAKWLMGLGIESLGFDSLGWRIASLVVGVIGVLLLYLLARKLLGTTTSATIAAGLLALDPLHFVLSRTAILDVFPTTFGIAAFLFLVYDRERMKPAADEETEPPPAFRSGSWWARPWRLAAGLAAGAATASKWSGGLFLVAVIALTVVWEVVRRRRLGWGRAVLDTAKVELPSIVLYLVVAPFALYVATYIGRLQGPVLQPLAEGSWAREWLRYQTNALGFHRSLEAHHGYESHPITWLLIKRPLLFWAETSGSGKSSIYAMGNPLIWWPGIVALVYVAIRWLRERDWLGYRGVILGGFATTYLSWLVLAPRRDAVFLFYVLPAIPFLCLALAGVVAREMTGVWRKVAIAITALFAVGWFFAYYPIMTNSVIPVDRWKAQMFFDDCEKPEVRETTTQTVTQAVNRNTTIVKTNRRVRTDDTDVPPTGWCWT